MNTSYSRCLIRAREGLCVAAAVLVLLAGCHGEDPVIPGEPRPDEWAAFRGDVGLADGSLADAAPPELCSSGNGASMTMRVTNTTAGPVTSFWVDFDCTERRYQVIEPGDTTDQMTFVDHVWRFRTAQGALVRQLVVEDTPVQEVEL